MTRNEYQPREIRLAKMEPQTGVELKFYVPQTVLFLFSFSVFALPLRDTLSEGVFSLGAPRKP